MPPTTPAAEPGTPPPPAPGAASPGKQWLRSRALILFVGLFAVVLLVGGFAVDLFNLRRQHLAAGIVHIEHHGRMLAEHTARDLAGLPASTLETSLFSSFCQANRPFDEFEAALIDTTGRSLALCNTPAAQNRSNESGADFRTILAAGSFAGLALDMPGGNAENECHVLVNEPVPGYPDLRIVSTASKERLLAQWRQQARQTLLIGVFALLALSFAALLIRRQFAEIARFTEELRRHRDTLESRISEATRELEQRRMDAELAADAKARFLTAASHDLRQPLHALNLFVEQLGRQGTDEQERIQLVQRIAQAANAMGEQLKGMLELSRLDMSCIKPQWTNVAVDELLRQLASTYRPLAEANETQLIIHACPRHIQGDNVLLFRLLGNLIDNAIKFSRGGTIFVAARWSADGGTRIEIRDDGQGIAPEFQQMIYEEFFQIGNRARDASAGLGLGLSIVSRIARLLEVPISLRSCPGGGSTFSLSFTKALPFAAPPESHLPLPLILVGLPGNSISSFARRAAEWGYQTAEAPDAASALQLINEYAGRHPILVIFCIRRQPFDAPLENLARTHASIVIHAEEREIGHLGPYHLNLPLKPARVRALLRSLHPRAHDRDY